MVVLYSRQDAPLSPARCQPAAGGYQPHVESCRPPDADGYSQASIISVLAIEGTL